MGGVGAFLFRRRTKSLLKVGRMKKERFEEKGARNVIWAVP